MPLLNHHADYLTRIAETNLAQREEEGVDMSEFRRRFDSLSEQPGTEKTAGLSELISDLEAALVREGFPYDEPNDLQRIRELAEPKVDLGPSRPDDAKVRDKVLGGWLGRAAGCMLGQPIEGTPLGYRKGEVRKHLEERELWPIRGYFDRGEPRRTLDTTLPYPFPGMTRDDDIDYVLLNLLLLEESGMDWTHEDARRVWTLRLAPSAFYAAGRAALTNFSLGMMPPETATWGNPCRQSLGAMIRCDTWGWVSPGDPDRAAELAWRDAVISQTTNGIYSGMFFAAVIAAAFVEPDIRRLVEVGLSQVPARSRFAEALRFTLDSWNATPDWQPAIDRIYERYGDGYFNHSIINACIVLLGLLSGGGDFERTIIDTVTCGFDADCTGATAGSIAGVILGASQLPGKWTEPLDDTYETWLTGLGPQRFSDLAKRTADIALRVS